MTDEEPRKGKRIATWAWRVGHIKLCSDTTEHIAYGLVLVAMVAFLGWVEIRTRTTIPAYLGFVLMLVGLQWLRREHKRKGERRVRQGLCRKCGYNLTGNVSGRCPECGEHTS